MLKVAFKIILLITLLCFFFVYDCSDFQNQVVEILPKPKKSAHQGLYVTYYMARTPKACNRIIQQAKQCGLDTIVVDAKWTLSEPFLKLVKEKQLNKHTKPVVDPWLAQFCKNLHEQGFIVSARLVVFKDDHLVIARPDLSVRLPDGSLYRDHKQGRWADPYSDEVRLFNELIAESAALSGADEVQFDYIRFPAEGKAKNAVFPSEKQGLSRVQVINGFLSDVKNRLKKYNTSIAIDIFGVTAWQSKNDIKNLGQDLKQMAKYIDVLCPMFYPSHFHRGYDGFANPGSEPYYFLSAGVRKTREILSSEAVAIVPWIQGFNMSSPNFGPDYINLQIKASYDEGAAGFLIWNARNDYSVSFQALKNKGYD